MEAITRTIKSKNKRTSITKFFNKEQNGFFYLIEYKRLLRGDEIYQDDSVIKILKGKIMVTSFVISEEIFKTTHRIMDTYMY